MQSGKVSKNSLIKEVLQYYQTKKLPFEQKEERINLDGRWYEKEILDKFQITFAPKGNVIKRSNNWDAEKLKEVGILDQGDKGAYDVFRDRILFPIFTHLGDVVGFAGRKPSSDKNKKNPKYLNSKESLLFVKRRLLYGLRQALPAIRSKEKAYIVEGYTDVLTMHQEGFTNTVATCGTAFTEQQAKLIKRFCDRVYFFRDGDEAGKKAMIKDVEVALKQKLQPFIGILPDGQDPDSFLREQGYKGFDFFLHESGQVKDGLLWRIMLSWDEKDPYKQQSTIKTAADLLAPLDDILRGSYVEMLIGKKYMGPKFKNQLNQAIKDKLNEIKPANTYGLTEEQKKDLDEYGIFEKNNCYYAVTGGNGNYVQISNFVMKPIMLIKSHRFSTRIIEVKNEKNRSFTLDFDSRDVYDIGSFSKIVEGYGNFMFNEYCKPQHFMRIKRKLYGNTATSYEIYTMGQHKDGFWTWGNGISYQGKFHPVNKFGLVDFQDTKYYLPAFSTVKDDLKSDDEENHFEDEKLFSFYTEGTPKVNFNEWASMMHRVHLDNGMMGVCWTLASLFRDIIYKKFSFFPHLFLFGPPSAGKSFMARSLVSMFGKPRQGFHLVHGSDVGFYLRLEQACNAVAWFEEYSNQVTFRRVEAIKASYDGSAHEKANRDDIRRTSKRKVKSSLLITGQQQPTQDVAAFKRCITLNFPPRSRTAEQNSLADELVTIQQSGQLSHITQKILEYRELIEQRFEVEFDTIRSLFKARLKDHPYDIEDRMLYNYCIPVTIMAILSSRLTFPWEFDYLAEYACQGLIDQSMAISTEDEVSIWWRSVQYMIEKGVIRKEVDFKTQVRHQEKFYDPVQRRDIIEETWEEGRELIYFRFTVAHNEYQLNQQKLGKNGLDLNALKYYLQTSEAYVGQKKAKKFQTGSHSCFVFDMAQLPLELEKADVPNPLDE
jgi:DNA primase